MDPDRLFLPRGYSENLAEPVNDEDGAGYWARPEELRVRRQRRYQDRVYRFADRLAAKDAIVLDVGCGIGENLVTRVASRNRRTIGVDQESAISVARGEFPDQEWISGDLRETAMWDRLGAIRPDVVICADVVEHVDDPLLFLERLRWVLSPGSILVLSTPDRTRVEDQPALGPPRNRHHIREWAEPEMHRLLESAGFVVRSSRHVLPRRYPRTWLEAKMVTWRAIHLRAVPGRRSCMVFELGRD